MQINKTILIPAVLVTVLVLGVGVASVSAQGANGQNFVSELAQKLGIDQAKVQGAVDGIKKDHQATMQQKLQQKLDADQAAGKLTEAQKQLILAKRTELMNQMQANRDAMKNMTPQQRKDAMQKTKSDLETWAKQNNIDLKYLMMGGRGFGKFGMGGMKKDK